MCLKTYIVYLFTLLVSFQVFGDEATTRSIEQRIAAYNTAFEIAFSNPTRHENNQVFPGEVLAFVNENGGESSIQSLPGGEVLMANLKRMNGFRLTSVQFNQGNCAQGDPNLADNILEASAQVSTCHYVENFSEESYRDLTHSWLDVFEFFNNPNSISPGSNRGGKLSAAQGIRRRRNRRKELHSQKASASEQIFVESILNSVRSSWSYKNLMGQDVSDARKLVSDICDPRQRRVGRVVGQVRKDPHFDCSQFNNIGLRAKIYEEAQRFVYEASRTSVLPLENQVRDLNHGIEQVNLRLRSVQVPPNERSLTNWFLDPDPDSSDYIEHMQYHQSFAQLAGSGIGTFLVTDHLQDERRVGKIRDMADAEDHFNRETRQYEFPEHNANLTVDDIEAAHREVQDEIHDHLTKLVDVQLNDDPSERLKFYAGINPTATGIALGKNPELAPFICEAINEINDDKEFKESLNSFVTAGSLVVGGIATVALAATGVGLLALPAATATLLSTTAGTAALTTAVVAGVGSGVTLFVNDSVNASNFRTDMIHARQAFITRNMGTMAIDELVELNNSYEDSLRNATIGGALIAADLLGLRIIRYAMGPARMQRASQGIARLTQLVRSNPKVSSLVDTIRSFGDGALGRFMAKLSRFDQAAQERILLRLAESDPAHAAAVVGRVTACTVPRN